MNCLCLLCLLGLCRSMGSRSAGSCSTGSRSTGSCAQKNPSQNGPRNAGRSGDADCGCARQETGGQSRFDEAGRGLSFGDTVPGMEPAQAVPYSTAHASYADGCACND